MKNGRIRNLMYQGCVSEQKLADKMHISKSKLQSRLKHRLKEKEQKQIEAIIYTLSKL